MTGCLPALQTINTSGIAADSPLATAAMPLDRCEVRRSAALSDPDWDSFLERSLQGEYQQSSLWAQAKAAEGWNVLRVVLSSPGGEILGGFQILHRRRRGLRIGYISRGPVSTTTPSYSSEFAALLQREIRAAGLSALLLQLPANSPAPAASHLNSDPFIPGDYKIIRSTIVIDLRDGLDAVVRRFRRSKRQEITQSKKHGLEIRDGSSADLPAFFNLMLETCRRQNSSPNPASLAALTSVYNAFAARNRAWLRLAQHNGRLVSAWLALAFGRTVTFYKMGWNGQSPEAHPNSLQIYDLIRRAAAEGYHFCDFAAAHPSLVASLQSGSPFTTDEKQLRDFYKTGFGGMPVRLPTPALYIPNRVLRSFYRFAASRSQTRNSPLE